MTGLYETRVIGLTPALSCIQASGEGRDRITLYHAFMAASVLLAHIKKEARERYNNLPLAIPYRCRFFPAISRLPRLPTNSNSNSASNPLEFMISDTFPTKAPERYLYIAQTTDGKEILVKFTKRYSTHLHLICAESGCAPALLGFQRLPGGFYAVAMEYIKDAVPITDFEDEETRKKWLKLLKEVVDKFHSQNLVHGDLRNPNIICSSDRVAIIDYDWAGESGKTCYPPGQLNEELVAGRDSDDLTITIADDLRVLSRTLRNVGLR